ncbi:MAG: hypothetical protein ACAH59_07735 [Pseudobdellovibrionaceae bacterium]
MLLQLMSFVMSSLLGQQAESGGLFPNITLASLRKLTMIWAAVAISLLVFLGGAFTVLFDLILASRDHGQLMLSPASIVGFSLMGFSILSLVALFGRSLWSPPAQLAQSREEAMSKALAPVAEAVAGVIRDFSEERKRAQAAMMAMASAPASDPTQTAYN